MKKLFIVFILLGILFFTFFGECFSEEEIPIGMAVEFMDHAASAYISHEKGWFEEEGLKLTSYESYVTGMALASALARGDIQVAYMCLVPAINAYANAKVPIKIVAGTHKYGYGLVVNPDKIKSIKDLERKDIRIGCVREGGAVDVLFHKAIDKYELDKEKVLNNIQRMNPPKQILAIQMGKLDAAFLPEQWATIAENFGFKMLLMSQDVWPAMQGSVIVVKKELIRDHPEIVKKLVIVSDKATDWINQNMYAAAEVVARQLQKAGGNLFPDQLSDIANRIEINPDVLFRSMKNLNYTANINPEIVQETIDYMAQLGYIKKIFKAEDILDLRFLEE
ncbi:MAG: ABC transporter substrate-binding protein [Candidatus Atribacteria bacterium]|nr:ABC transporter substrate-binding protein [Candidatus Atribacteria bacterium]